MPSAADSSSCSESFKSLPILDLSWANDSNKRPQLLRQLHEALFNIGFMYVINHGVPGDIIQNLTSILPDLFNLSVQARNSLSKINSPHFLGYSGFAEETTLGEKDSREQFDFATELPIVWRSPSSRHSHISTSSSCGRDFSKPFWRLRGPNQWPAEDLLPGFRKAYNEYHDAVSKLSYSFVHLVEEAFGIPIGTFDEFFSPKRGSQARFRDYHPPQHRIKLLKYPPNRSGSNPQGVGAHKDSSGWLTFLYQVGTEEGLEVVNSDGAWIPVRPIENSFVVNFGNAFEAATEGAVRATVHRVKAPTSESSTRYSIPFFQGLPLDLTVSEIRSFIPEDVRSLRRRHDEENKANSNGSVSAFLDPRWDSLGESQLRKWIRSHEEVGRKWYGDDIAGYYLS